MSDVIRSFGDLGGALGEAPDSDQEIGLRLGDHEITLCLKVNRQKQSDKDDETTDTDDPAPEADGETELPDEAEPGALLEIIALANLGEDGLGLDDILGAFAELFGDTRPDLPDWLGSGGARLRSLGIRFDEDMALAGVMARLEPVGAGHFEIVPDILGVDQLALELIVSYPFDGERAEIELTASGAMALGAARVQARIEARDATLLRRLPEPAPEARSKMAEDLVACLPDPVDAGSDNDDDLDDLLEPPPTHYALKEAFETAATPHEATPTPFSQVSVRGWLESEVALSDFGRAFGLDGSGLSADAERDPGRGPRISDGRFNYISETGTYALALTLLGGYRETPAPGLDGMLADPLTPDPLALRPTRAPLLQLPGDMMLSEATLHVGGSTADGRFYAEVAGQVRVAGARVDLSAGYFGSEGGIALEGRWRREDVSTFDREPDPQSDPDYDEGGTIIPTDAPDADRLSDFLTSGFGVALPEPLRGLQVNEFGALIETGTRHVCLDLDVELPASCLGGSPETRIDARVQVDLRRSDEGYVGQFQGVLAVGDQTDPWELDLLISRDDQRTALLAGYRVQSGPAGDETQSVGALAGALDLGEGIGELDIVVREAMLATLWTDGAGASDTLLSADVEGGLDLARFELPDLPILGALGLPGPDPMRLRVKISYVAGSGSDEAIRTLGALASEAGFHPPEGLGNGFNIHPVLQIGDEILSVDTAPGGQDQASPGGTDGLARDDLANTDKKSDDAPDAAALDDGAQWIDVQRGSDGPVYIRRVGLALHRPGDGKPSEIEALLDASLQLAGLTVSLEGLSVRAALGDLVPTYSIDGLGIDYHGGIEIGGALHKRDHAFAGELIAEAGTVSVSAIGLFESREGESSFLAHAVVDYPIGGPAFFFVTGFALGFGFNRSVVEPELKRVDDFVLVDQAGDASPPGRSRESRLVALDAVREALPFHADAHFVAAGIEFTSFKTVNSVALLLVQFGEQGSDQELSFMLLGQSTLRNPPEETGERPFAYARMLWKVTFTPSEGELAVEATLTPDSFAIDRNCKLSGGLAFYAWFGAVEGTGRKGPKAGDFVLTLGGYHPDFDVPAHFPSPERIGLDWQVTENFSIRATAYFAMTAGAVMAGGSLDAEWSEGSITASFLAEADLLVAWRPHHYDIRLFVHITGTVTIHFLGTHSLSLDASADVRLWGPDMAGRATVHVYFWGYDFPFDIAFNDSPRLAAAISWKDFASEQLPDRILTVAPAGGQLAEAEGKALRFDPRDMRLRVDTAVPFNSLQGTHNRRLHSVPGVFPCGSRSWDSTLSLTITGPGDPPGSRSEFADKFDVRCVKGSVPAALWGKPKITPSPDPAHLPTYIVPPKVNDDRLIDGANVGLEITVKRPVSGDDPDRVPGTRNNEQPEEIARILGGAPSFHPAAEPELVAPLSKQERASMLRALGLATHPLAQAPGGRARPGRPPDDPSRLSPSQ
ncbi:DUF6603 domain-containing protein [Rhodosalinus sp.]|uniref:DUF6603 domain-containing protein n=1 Tax=Rhodosalinus sp. TaxID=2047741 RepID=UPI0035660CC8